MKRLAPPTLATALALSLSAVLAAAGGPETTGSDDVVAERKAALQKGAEMGPIHCPDPGLLVSEGSDAAGNPIRLEARLDPSPADSGVRQQVVDALGSWVDTYNRGDWSLSLDFYSRDPRFHFVEKGRRVYLSKSEVEEGVRELYQTVSAADIRLGEPMVTPLGSGLAHVVVEYRQEIVFSPEQSLSMEGTMTLLLHREGDAWRILTGDSETHRIEGPREQ